MRLFRNPEVRQVLYIGIPLATLAWFLLYFLSGHDWPILLVSGGAFLLLLALFFVVMRLHFDKVIRFRERVKKNARGRKDLQFNDFSEGEFSILQDEILKMTVEHFCQKEELLRQQEELQNEKQMLTEALENIMHQIKTPLFAIETTARLQLGQTLDAQEQKVYAQRIMKRQAQISRLVTMLLKMARMDAGVMEYHKTDVSAKALFQEVCKDDLDIWMELNGIESQLDIPNDVTLYVDKDLFKEAMINIIKNCIEHMPDGGKLSVRISDDPVYTDIVIRDTGTGIAPESQPHLFERFYRGKEYNPDSIGIGLSFVKDVLAAHNNSTISADNHPDGGAVFTICLKKYNNI